MSITLNNYNVYKRGKFLKISKNTIKITHSTVKSNEMKEAIKERKREVLHKQVGVDEVNIVSTKREKIKVRY